MLFRSHGPCRQERHIKWRPWRGLTARHPRFRLRPARKSPLAGARLEAPIGVRFPPRGWLRTALSSGMPHQVASLAGPTCAPSAISTPTGADKPPCGGSSGGADRSRTDAYGICSPGPYHLATAPCVAVVLLERTRAAWAARSVERVMGFEPTTSTLARLHSTTELHPHERPRLAMAGSRVNGQFFGPVFDRWPSAPAAASARQAPQRPKSRS